MYNQQSEFTISVKRKIGIWIKQKTLFDYYLAFLEEEKGVGATQDSSPSSIFLFLVFFKIYRKLWQTKILNFEGNVGVSVSE